MGCIVSKLFWIFIFFLYLQGPLVIYNICQSFKKKIDILIQYMIWQCSQYDFEPVNRSCVSYQKYIKFHK